MKDSDGTEPARSARASGSIWWHAAALVVVTAVMVTAAIALDLPSTTEARDWLVSAGPAAWAGVVLLLAVALVTPAPRSAVSVFVGAVAGFPTGLTIVVLAGILGGLAGYGLSRWLGRAAFVRLVGDRLDRSGRFVARRSVLAVVVARVSPVPFVVVSYAAGLTGVPFRPYLVGTAIGVLPGSVLYVGVGASLTLLTPWASQLPALGVGILLLVTTVAVVMRRRGRASPHR